MDSDEWSRSDEIVSIHHPTSAAEWRSVMQPYFGVRNAPLNRCMDVAISNGACTVVVERRYYDVDYRSEFSEYFSRLHGDVPSITHRLHFFADVIELSDVGNLQHDKRYLGYIVIRPTPLGPISRAMLKPPPDIFKAIRARVSEDVCFFGDKLSVEGVPFTQQDGQLCKCAHSAAWMCHYAAYLRGDVARVPRAEFATQVNASLNNSRLMPSSGLTVSQLSDLFRTFRIPAVFYALGELPDDRLPWQPPPATPPPPDAQGRVPVAGYWDHGVVPILCRYLNSGLPVLVGTHDHAFVVCGYRRSKTRQGWIDFYRNDDQQGPYMPVADVLNDSGQTPWRTMHVPVSGKMWLSPEAAELYGGKVLERASSATAQPISRMYGAPVEPLSNLIAGDRLALKTYICRSSAFKEALLERGLPLELARLYRLAPMSRYVVIVEAIDRTLRSANEACVVGQAILDSTSADSAPSLLAFDVHGVGWPMNRLKPEVCITGPYLSGAVGPP
ncbi:MAG: hypothetical protein ACLQNG_06985 [Acidimicrobiales bacterium]